MNSNEEKYGFLSELIRLMKSDGQTDDSELRFIAATAEHMQLTPEEFQSILNNPRPYLPPKSPAERMVQLYQMALLIRTDGVNTEEEVKHMQLLGIKMGLRHEAVSAVLGRLTNHPNEMLTAKEVIAIFQVFHN